MDYYFVAVPKAASTAANETTYGMAPPELSRATSLHRRAPALVYELQY